MSDKKLKSIPLGQPFIRKDILMKEIEKVLDSKWISGGPTIGKFEQAVKEFNKDSKGHYIAVANGTVALELALRALNNGKFYTKEDEIIVPSWSWVASGFSVINVGATPVWCDVNKYGVPDIKTVEKLITEHTKAIMLVHQMGIPCDLDEFKKLAVYYNVPIVEDAACALGSEYKGKRIGNVEDSDNIVTYSFQARKVLTTGEGGMVIVRDKKKAELIQSMRMFGTNSTPLSRAKSDELVKEKFVYVGTNYKMSDIQAAMGLGHLQYIEDELEMRNRAAANYDNLIQSSKILSEVPIVLLSEPPEYCTYYNYQNYHVALPNDLYYKDERDNILTGLKKRGIGCKWDIQQTHKEPCINNTVTLLITEHLANKGFWLPFYAEITEKQQAYVVKQLEEVVDELFSITSKLIQENTGVGTITERISLSDISPRTWTEYQFVPKEDITTYELSLAQMALILLANGADNYIVEEYINNFPTEVRRHFIAKNK